MTDLWELVHAERVALIHDLRSSEKEDWDQPSLCPRWSVHDVVAHLVDNACTTRAGFVAGLVGARFDFDRLNERGVRRHCGATAEDTLAHLRAVASRTSGPPAPRDSRLVEEVVHGEDIRQPLGLHRSYPVESVERALRVQASTPVAHGGAKELTQRVRLVATDADVAVGSGPEVRGQAVQLLLAVCGRAGATATLSGPGLRAVVDAAG